MSHHIVDLVVQVWTLYMTTRNYNGLHADWGIGRDLTIIAVGRNLLDDHLKA
jgi:hypothetical protein